jgi:hypothetical protein
MKTKFNIAIVQKSSLILILSFFSVISASALSPINTDNQLVTVPVPLYSVVYQSITTSITEKSVILNWNTTYEFQNSHFEVERSTDMKDFKTVALVLDGFDTEGLGKRYAYKEDNTIIKNGRAVYYRLKQFDMYGNISYSKIMKVQHTKMP